MTLSLFQDMEQCQSEWEELCSGAIVLRGFVVLHEVAILDSVTRYYNQSSISSYGHSRRFPDVCGADELRFLWLGHGSHRLSL